MAQKADDTINWRPGRGVIAFVTVPALLLGAGAWALSKPLESVLKGDERPACTPETSLAPLQNSFKLNVLNASESQGAATRVAAELPLRWFTPGRVSNYTGIKEVNGSGSIRFGPSGIDGALVVRQLLLPDAALVRDDRFDDSVDLILGPTFTTLAPADRPLVYRQDVKVNVYNTTYFTGLATKADEDLTRLGFVTGKVGLDPKKGWVTGVAAVRYGPHGKLYADLLAKTIPDAELVLDPTATGTDVDLLIGMKWQGVPDASMTEPEAKKPALTRLTVTRPCP